MDVEESELNGPDCVEAAKDAEKSEESFQDIDESSHECDVFNSGIREQQSPAGENATLQSEEMLEDQSQNCNTYSSAPDAHVERVYEEPEEDCTTSNAEKADEMGGSFSSSRKRKTNRWSDNDTKAYRLGYPDKSDSKGRKNFEFYTNKLKCKPDEKLIDEIHEEWWGNYRLLEDRHGYIQWLFPMRESGLNYYAQELNTHEAKEIQNDTAAKKRVLKSYEMMLDFYGMQLLSAESGEIRRAENWKARFDHLNRSRHNYLRITRILKSLGELGFEHLKYPFVDFVLGEALLNRTLKETKESCANYWIGTIKNDSQRNKLYDFYEENS